MSFSITGSDAVAPRKTRASAPWNSFASRLLSPLAFAVLLAAGASLVPPRKPAPAPVTQASSTVPATPWAGITKPLPLFDLSSSAFGREALVYTARRHRDGGGRQDLLTFGTFAGDDPFLELELYRIGREQVPESDFFVTLARTAAHDGIAVMRGQQPDPATTRFGDMQVAPVQALAGPSARSCLGFKLGVADPKFRMTGLACGAAAHPLEPTALVCALDRLDLLAPGEDNDLADFFARSEFQRDTGCPRALAAENIERPDDLAIERRHGPQRRRSPR